MESLHGLGVALVTPFDDNLEIDFSALARVLDHLYASKAVDYLVVLGSTGEAAALSAAEKQAVLTFVKDHNKGRLPLLFGHSGNNTTELVKTLNTIDSTGYAAVLSASPAYVKPPQDGIIAHYQQLADNSPLPILLYNVPSRTGSNMTAGTTLTLAGHENIIGIKEASGNVEQALAIRAGSGDSFLLISGDDMLTVPLCSVGATGLISVLGNAYPGVYKDMLTLCSKGNYRQAAGAATRTMSINELMYKEGNPVGIKQLLAAMGLCRPNVRLPLVKASQSLAEEIQANLL